MASHASVGIRDSEPARLEAALRTDDDADDYFKLLSTKDADFAPGASGTRAFGKNESRFQRLKTCLATHSPRALVITSIIAQAIPLLIIALMFAAGTWLSYALHHYHHLTPGDWDRLYQLVGRKVLRPRSWFYFSLVLAFALLELGMMVWTQYQRGNHRLQTRTFYRVYMSVHFIGSLLNICMLVYVIDGGVRVIKEHILGPENFLKSWL